MKCNINELTLGQIKELQAVTSAGPQSFGGTPGLINIGDKVFIRTVTYHLLGRVSEVIGSWVRLTDVSWIADSGRWNEALSTGSLNEVEKCGRWALCNLASAVDIHPWEHDLPVISK